jgi:hypothetical protein
LDDGGGVKYRVEAKDRGSLRMEVRLRMKVRLRIKVRLREVR